MQVTPPGGRYLAEVPDLPAYYTRGIIDRRRWHTTIYFDSSSHKGQRKALREGRFDVIVLQDPGFLRVYDLRGEDLERTGKYERVAMVEGAGTTYEVWVKRGV